jgi:hypothetical protein
VSRVPPGGAARVRRPGRQHDRQAEIESLLRDLGAQLKRAGGIREGPGRLPVGRAEIDRLLGGGFPLGALSEVSGAPSSGRTSLSLALLANTTSRGELAGWIDCADAFDPPSAERLGVDLDRVLWVRARSAEEALRASEQLIRTEGFPLVLLDWHADLPAPGTASWIRLTRVAAATRTALLLSSAERLAGAHAELALCMQPARARFSGTPTLLEELETRMVLVRNRAGAVDPMTSFEVRLRSPHESAA